MRGQKDKSHEAIGAASLGSAGHLRNTSHVTRSNQSLSVFYLFFPTKTTVSIYFFSPDDEYFLVGTLNLVQSLPFETGLSNNLTD